MPNIPSAIMNKADQRTLLAAFRAERDAAEKVVKRLKREQDGLYKEGDSVFKALHKAAFASKKKYDKLAEDLGWKIASANQTLVKAEAKLLEVKSNLGIDTGADDVVQPPTDVFKDMGIDPNPNLGAALSVRKTKQFDVLSKETEAKLLSKEVNDVENS